ncbi:MAG: Amine oxidase, flavin-containing [uncultured Acidimicrobiales bacterium]|uniref:Amine oxidase, flavin-containing n=1 Tax=uncultured Acidimicrobiales bacterium TaxID=310071 RepID=A0A6J4HPC2_9ACTN|nr:MAG: Amine oxidase, flavin-containing [uncultured Acidimicrobiales bacterium]
MTAPRRTEPRIVIIGAGPTGLGAGYRLQQLGHEDWVILEATDRVGGLATSFTDEAGFTYDIGGHVMFSHYDYYDDLVDKLMGGDYTELQREAWVWMEDRFIPYPFQNNIRDLDPQTVFDCVNGLIKAQREDKPFSNFKEWVDSVMGAGIAEHFMIPYNFKVWATPAELMNFVWIGERVSVVDTESILRNVILREDQVSWGPNNTFKYPLRGGTGYLYEGMRTFVEDHLELETPVASVDPVAKQVRTADGRTWDYDVLLNTMPLNKLIERTDGAPAEVAGAVDGLHWSGSHIVGVGVDRQADTSKNWIYFPEPDVPFYRVTYLSNYSPYMTAKPGQTLFLTETSQSHHKPEDASTIVQRVIDGLVSTKLMEEADRDLVVTTWLCSPEMSYPVPSVTRDTALGTIQPWLRSQDIWSRGRFGAWLYEIGNMDHSAMQGVEFVDAVLEGKPETVWIPRGEGEAGAGIR